MDLCYHTCELGHFKVHVLNTGVSAIQGVGLEGFHVYVHTVIIIVSRTWHEKEGIINALTRTQDISHFAPVTHTHTHTHTPLNSQSLTRTPKIHQTLTGGPNTTTPVGMIGGHNRTMLLRGKIGSWSTAQSWRMLSIGSYLKNIFTVGKGSPNQVKIVW